MYKEIFNDMKELLDQNNNITKVLNKFKPKEIFSPIYNLYNIGEDKLVNWKINTENKRIMFLYDDEYKSDLIIDYVFYPYLKQTYLIIGLPLSILLSEKDDDEYKGLEYILTSIKHCCIFLRSYDKHKYIDKSNALSSYPISVYHTSVSIIEIFAPYIISISLFRYLFGDNDNFINNSIIEIISKDEFRFNKKDIEFMKKYDSKFKKFVYMNAEDLVRIVYETDSKGNAIEDLLYNMEIVNLVTDNWKGLYSEYE